MDSWRPSWRSCDWLHLNQAIKPEKPGEHLYDKHYHKHKFNHKDVYTCDYTSTRQHMQINISKHSVDVNILQMNEVGGTSSEVLQNLVETLDEFPSYFIQSKTSTSAHEWRERILHVASKLLEHTGTHRGLKQFSETRCNWILFPRLNIACGIHVNRPNIVLVLISRRSTRLFSYALQYAYKCACRSRYEPYIFWRSAFLLRWDLT